MRAELPRLPSDPKVRAAVLVWAAALCWITLLGPSAERCMSALLAPALAWALVAARVERWPAPRGWLPAVALGLLVFSVAAGSLPGLSAVHAWGAQMLAALLLAVSFAGVPRARPARLDAAPPAASSAGPAGDRPCRLSVVCPAYEEEAVLPAFHAELCDVLGRLPASYEIEILYVDDGSSDRTPAVLRGLVRSDPRVRYLSLSRNFGHQAALTAGLEHATGDVVITLDSDLQHPPALIPELLARWEDGYDVVQTLREEDRELGPFKRLTSRGFYALLRLVSDVEVRSAASDYRLLSRRAVDALARLGETHRFLRGLVRWVGFPTAHVPFRPSPRAAGRSKYTLSRMARLAGDGLLSFSRVPLRLAFVLGAACVLLGIGLLGHAGVLAARGDAGASAGWRVVLVAVCLVGGSILGCLGLLGEVLGRVYEQAKGRPLYVLKERSPEAAAPPAVAGVTTYWDGLRPSRDAG